MSHKGGASMEKAEQDYVIDRILARPPAANRLRTTPVKKGHVPSEKLPRYRHLMAIAKHLEDAADLMGAEFAGEANSVYAIGQDFKEEARKLRVDLED